MLPRAARSPALGRTDLLQGPQQVGCRLEPAIRRLGEQASDDGGQCGAAGEEVGRIVVDDRVERIDRVLARESTPARHQLEENRSQREQVRPRIDRIALDLLGREIAGRSQDDPGERREAGWQRGILRELRDAEVEDLRRARRGQEDVLGLEIAMDQPSRVRGHQAARHRGGDATGVLRRDRPSADRRPQGLAVQQFRDQVRATVRHPHVEHLDDVGVVERRGDPRFLQEPLDRVPIAALRRSSAS